MSSDIRPATLQDQPALLRMLELYQHDLSDIWDQELDARGEYGYALDRYWQGGPCHPFVATVNGHYAGFALVDGAVKVVQAGHWMDQFFVLKKYRRTGVGKLMALQVFAALPGRWEVGQMLGNLAAQSFWRRVIGQNIAGGYVEHTLVGSGWQGHVQCFTHGAPP